MAWQEVIIAQGVCGSEEYTESYSRASACLIRTEDENVETRHDEECLQRVVFAADEISWHVDLSHFVEDHKRVHADAKGDESQDHYVNMRILE